MSNSNVFTVTSDNAAAALAEYAQRNASEERAAGQFTSEQRELMEFAEQSRLAEKERPLAARDQMLRDLAHAPRQHNTGWSVTINSDGTSTTQELSRDEFSSWSTPNQGAQPGATLTATDASGAPIGHRPVTGNDRVHIPGQGEWNVAAAIQMGVAVRQGDGSLTLAGQAQPQEPTRFETRAQNEGQEPQANELAPEYAEIGSEVEASVSELRSAMGDERLERAASLVVVNGWSQETADHIASELDVPVDALVEHMGPAVERYQAAADTAVKRVLGPDVDLDAFYTAVSHVAPDLVNRGVRELLNTGSVAVFRELARTFAGNRRQ